MNAAVAGPGASTGRGVRMSLQQAARRTGLADADLTMSRVCELREVPVVRLGPAARGFVSLDSFLGEPVTVEVGEVQVLEYGSL